jgi:ABC-type cobalt transport system substrate-binding protein
MVMVVVVVVAMVIVMVVVMVTIDDNAAAYLGDDCHAGAAADEGANSMLISTVVVW